VTLAFCIVQSLIGWDLVESAIGFVPSAVWAPSSWFSVLPGQALPVAATWLTYVFPHMGWAHMLGNVLALLVFGSVVEPMMGTRRYAVMTMFAAVFGVFGFAVIYPLGTSAIAGGSLLLCTILGIWLASYTQAWRDRHRSLTIALETTVCCSLLAWLVFRTTPTHPSGLIAALWHAPSLMVGWLGWRIASALQAPAGLWPRSG
jgi:membrane associated rhomboid family serine protease